MNRKEYEEKRRQLLNEAQKLIDSSNAAGAEEKMKEITALDEQWDKEAQAKANYAALNNEPQSVNVPWFGNSMTDFRNGSSYTGSIADECGIFLEKNMKMTDVALKDNAEAIGLMQKDGALGAVIKGMVTGQWESPELKNTVTTTSTGVLIPSVLSAQVIDLARNISLFTVAGVPVVPMKSNNMTISRIKKDPTFSFKEEGKEGKETDFELDGVELKSKTCYGYAYVSLEAIHSSNNLDAILKTVFAAGIAESIDKTMLYGQKTENAFDSFAPSGIMNDADILTVESGEKSSYDDIIKGIGAIRKNNGVPSAWAVNAQTEEELNMLKTLDGQYLNAPKAVEKLQKIVSNQLAYDEDNGSDGLVFDPASMLIGIQNNIQIKIIEDEKCLKNGMVGFQIYTMQDCKVVRPKSICKIIGMK